LLERILLFAPMLLLAMVAHEYAHGWAARQQGDPTAESLGRLTWNPLKHIDPFLTVLLPLMIFVSSGGNMIFGGAKPVPVDPRNYRNVRRGDIVVSLAGITANLLLVPLLMAGIVAAGAAGRALPDLVPSLALLQRMLGFGIAVNLLLAVFNLLPVPPLDGSHVVKWFLPRRWAVRYQRVGMYGFLVLMLLLTFGRPVLSAWMAPALWLDGWSAHLLQGWRLDLD
jgi:Zn-dependent protease